MRTYPGEGPATALDLGPLVAYAVALAVTCTETGCSKPATHEVRNGRNETVRKCCRRHAEDLVARLSADEQPPLSTT